MKTAKCNILGISFKKREGGRKKNIFFSKTEIKTFEKVKKSKKQKKSLIKSKTGGEERMLIT